MLATMPAAEYEEWRLFAFHYPFGEEGQWLRAGVLGSLLANQWRGKDGKAVTPAEVALPLPGRRRGGRREAQLDAAESRELLRGKAAGKAGKGRAGKAGGTLNG